MPRSARTTCSLHEGQGPGPVTSAGVPSACCGSAWLQRAGPHSRCTVAAEAEGCCPCGLSDRGLDTAAVTGRLRRLSLCCDSGTCHPPGPSIRSQAGKGVQVGFWGGGGCGAPHAPCCLPCQGRAHRRTAGHARGRQPGHEADHHRDTGAGPHAGESQLRAHLQGHHSLWSERGQAPQVARSSLSLPPPAQQRMTLEAKRPGGRSWPLAESGASVSRPGRLRPACVSTRAAAAQ